MFRSAFLLLAAFKTVVSQSCMFPEVDTDVCDPGFLAFAPQRFIGDTRFDTAKFQLLGKADLEDVDGKWYYQSRERPGKKLLSMKKRFRKAASQSYEKTEDEAYPHTFKMEINEDELVPGSYVFKTTNGKKCTFIVY